MSFKYQIILKSGIVRLGSIGAQFASIIILSRLLPPNIFGDFMLTLAAFRLIGLSIGTGMGSLLSFLIATRRCHSKDEEIITHKTIQSIGIVVASIASLIILEASDFISEIFNKPGIYHWVRELWPTIIGTTIVTTAVGFYDAKSQVSKSLLVSDLAPSVLQLIGVFSILLFNLNPNNAAYVFSTSTIIPALIVYGLSISSNSFKFCTLSKFDIKYIISQMFTMLCSQQVNGIDIIILGYFLKSEQIGIYSICAKVSLLIPFFQNILLRKHIKKAGEVISEKDYERLNNEFEPVKLTSYTATLLMASACVAAYNLMTFIAGYPPDSTLVLLSLVPSFLIRANFGGIDMMLKLSGKIGASAVVSALSAITFSLICFISASFLHEFSPGASLAVSALITCTIGSSILKMNGIYIENTTLHYSTLGAIVIILISLLIPDPNLRVALCIISLVAISVATLIVSKKKLSP